MKVESHCQSNPAQRASNDDGDFEDLIAVTATYKGEIATLTSPPMLVAPHLAIGRFLAIRVGLFFSIMIGIALSPSLILLRITA